MSFLQNHGEEWHNLKFLSNNNGGHNENCSIDSESCSKEMATDVPQTFKSLCKWHRARMANHYVVNCGCRSHDICSGDGVGRMMFRNYYDRWDIAVQDACDTYCCGPTQNGDSQTHQCGSMMVCPEHVHFHDDNVITELVKSDSDVD